MVQVFKGIGLIYTFLSLTPLILDFEHITIPPRMPFAMLGQFHGTWLHLGIHNMPKTEKGYRPKVPNQRNHEENTGKDLMHDELTWHNFFSETYSIIPRNVYYYILIEKGK